MTVARSILLIDDESRNIFALRLVLQSRGYKVLAAGDAARGIRMMREDPGIAVVLLDMMMPGMDGYQALDLIRNDEQLRAKPVIAVTAQAMSGDREKCLEAGATGYISKPIDVDELIRILNPYFQETT